MTADWDAVLAEGERLQFAADHPNNMASRIDGVRAQFALHEFYRKNGPALLSAALRERESAKDAEREKAIRKSQQQMCEEILHYVRPIIGETLFDDIDKFGEQHNARIAALAAEKGEQT